MTPDLPPAIAAYFAADAAGDLQAFADLFAPGAVVIDERRRHEGREQIRAWKAEASSRFTYTVRPFALATHTDRIVVTARLTGDFPGSPVDLRYAFALADDLIDRLEIAP